MIGRIAAIESRRERLDAEHARRIRGLERDLKSIAWEHGLGLENWLRDRLRGHKRKKSVDTAEGRAGLSPTGIRTSAEKDASRVLVDVLDAGEVADWCAIQPDADTYGRSVFRVDWPALKKLVAQGLIVPGTRTAPAGDKLYVKAEGLKKQVNLTKLRATPLGPDEADEFEEEEQDEARHDAAPATEEEE